MSTNAPAVAMRQGPVRGSSDGTVLAFRGIPYAAPPVAELRFRPPAAHAGWSGTWDGSRSGPAVPQGRSRLEAVMGPQETGWDEGGCLNLNVWTPVSALHGTSPRPVLVWFHGGGFTSGSGGWDWYDGGHLAAAGDIVVVTANYRLGPLGYLRRPGIGADNLGCQDQAAVLRWARDNIAAFGGDPAQVTVGGQSAGAYSALMLAIDPATTHLVHRVIAQSGPWALDPQPQGAADEAASRYLALLGIDSDEALRQVPAADLVTAYGELAVQLARPGNIAPPMYPVLGGPGTPLGWQDGLERAGGTAKQVLIGSTEDEMTAFLAMTGGLPEGTKAATEQAFGAGVTQIAEACAARGTPAVVYRFARVSTADPALGATHCSDLPFAFDNLDAYTRAPMLGPVGDFDRTLAHSLSGALARFVATGVAGNPDWPAYRPREDRHVRRFGG
jgi:para-nitrobenzyl esterase